MVSHGERMPVKERKGWESKLVDIFMEDISLSDMIAEYYSFKVALAKLSKVHPPGKTGDDIYQLKKKISKQMDDLRLQIREAISVLLLDVLTDFLIKETCHKEEKESD